MTPRLVRFRLGMHPARSAPLWVACRIGQRLATSGVAAKARLEYIHLDPRSSSDAPLIIDHDCILQPRDPAGRAPEQPITRLRTRSRLRFARAQDTLMLQV